eukprot:18902-Heterococcus_DN1.PRE.1
MLQQRRAREHAGCTLPIDKAVLTFATASLQLQRSSVYASSKVSFRCPTSDEERFLAGANIRESLVLNVQARMCAGSSKAQDHFTWCWLRNATAADAITLQQHSQCVS